MGSTFWGTWEDPRGGFFKFAVKRASKQDQTLHMEGKLHVILYFRAVCATKTKFIVFWKYRNFVTALFFQFKSTACEVCIEWWLLELLGGQFHLVMFILKTRGSSTSTSSDDFQLDTVWHRPRNSTPWQKKCYIFSVLKKVRLIFFRLENLIIRPFNTPKFLGTWTFLAILPQLPLCFDLFFPGSLANYVGRDEGKRLTITTF